MDQVPNPTAQFCISQIRVSDLRSGYNEDKKALLSLSNSPCIDFIKNGFSFTEPPKPTSQVGSCDLKEDLLVLSWEGSIGGSKVNECYA